MTTIAYRAGVLAFDELMTEGWTRAGFTRKGFVVGPYIVGCAGSIQLITAFIDHLHVSLAASAKLPAIPKELRAHDDHSLSAILIDAYGRVWMYENCGMPFEATGEYFAMGSGGNVALGAMYMGATAEEAVEAAMAWDAGSGGNVQALYITDLLKRESNVVKLRKKRKTA